VKRLPSSVYWAGLRSWGVLQFAGSQDDYHRSFDALQRARRAAVRRDDGDAALAIPRNWHAGLPAPPPTFPAEASLDLRRDEAEWLSERVRERHGATLLAYLVERGVPDNADWPWAVERDPGLSATNRVRLAHARRFSTVMYGAALVYNHALASRIGPGGEARRPELVTEYLGRLADWHHGLDRDEIAAWSLEELWTVSRADGHTVTRSTKEFVTQWRELALARTVDGLVSAPAQGLITAREKALKKGRSRFLNETAYGQWNGGSGARPFSYRWPTVVQFVRDLHAALKEG
jgi:hypothetical protein